MDMIKPFVEKLVYPLMGLARGNRVKNYLKELKASESLPSPQLAKQQREKLEHLVDHCVRNVPAYRLEAGGDTGNLKARWRTIRPLTREIFRAHPQSYLTNGVSKEDLIPAASGGSTDAPLKFFLDRVTLERYEAARWRGLSWWGITPGHRSVMLWGSPVELSAAGQKAYRRREKWLKNRVIIPAHDLSETNLPGHIKFLNRYRPAYFYGYASALYTFAQLMEQTGAKLKFTPKIVLSTAETLFDHQREAIKRSFGCPVVNEYGAKDAGILAYECPKGGLHITCENVLLEVLDPTTLNPLPVGEKGVLASTDLCNLSMPRLRYFLGDIASLSSERCACGRTLPLLGGLEGRLVDMLVARDSPRGVRFVHGNALARLSRICHGVARFQICQHTPDKATLYTVGSPDAREKDLDKFTERVRAFLPGVDITLRVVEDIPLMASGKHRYAVREFPLSAVPRQHTEEEETSDEADQ